MMTSFYGMKAVVAACLVLAFAIVHVDAYRAQQDYINTNIAISAEGIFAMRPDGGNDTLYDVVMIYDNDYDRLSGGIQDFWHAPVQFLLFPDYWKKFLRQSGPLGVAGPLGPSGPLSAWGPIGTNQTLSLNSTGCDWCSDIASFFTSMWSFDNTSPLGPYGPLGYMGPLAPKAIYYTMYHLNEVPFGANNFPHNLDILGAWGVLGPLGPLGALGALGPLGPLGPVSSITTTINPATKQYDGQYRNVTTGEILRTVQVLYDPTNSIYRVYDLFELYPVNVAQSLSDNDCSFAVEGKLTKSHLSDSFEFTSQYDHMVSALVIPNMMTRGTAVSFSDFDVRVNKLNSKGKFVPIAQSALTSSHQLSPSTYQGYIDSVIWRAHIGDRFRVDVFTTASKLEAENTYRLFVTGTGFRSGSRNNEVPTDTYNHRNIYGPHIGAYAV